jgi:hypothetical protein
MGSVMETKRALDQIAEIHEHLARGEVYRDYRALPVGLSGVGAVLAAALQRPLIGEQPGIAFVGYWLTVAAVCAAIAASGVLRGYLQAPSPAQRRHTRTVVGQLAPSLVAGVLISVPLGLAGPRLMDLLPGLWSILFSLGVFASRPYLPRNIGWVALYYLAAGLAALGAGVARPGITPWSIGFTFGVGQVLAALVLYWNLERRSDERA